MKKNRSYVAGHPGGFRAIVILTSLFLIAPALIVILASFNSTEYLSFPLKGLSIKWILSYITSPLFTKSFTLSLLLAFIAAVGALFLGVPASIALVRGRFPGRKALQALLVSPLMLPGAVIGLALYAYYVNLGVLARSFTGLVIAHVLIAMPFVIISVVGSLSSFDTDLENAARVLGANALQAFFKITIPIIYPSIMVGGFLGFIYSFSQFAISLFLSTPDLDPLPVSLYSTLRFSYDPRVAAAGTISVLIVVSSMLIVNRFTNLDKWFAGFRF